MLSRCLLVLANVGTERCNLDAELPDNIGILMTLRFRMDRAAKPFRERLSSFFEA
jgi:hypothetical protein